jgi:flagellar biosynthetic protein FliO
MTPSPDLTLATIKMVVSLVLVLGLLWGLYLLTRKKISAGHKSGPGEMIQILENRYLGVKKSIALVQVPGSILVVGVSADKLNLLNKIDDPGILSTLDAKRTQKIQPNFISLFKRAAQHQVVRDAGSAPEPALNGPQAD